MAMFCDLLVVLHRQGLPDSDHQHRIIVITYHVPGTLLVPQKHAKSYAYHIATVSRRSASTNPSSHLHSKKESIAAILDIDID